MLYAIQPTKLEEKNFHHLLLVSSSMIIHHRYHLLPARYHYTAITIAVIFTIFFIILVIRCSYLVSPHVSVYHHRNIIMESPTEEGEAFIVPMETAINGGRNMLSLTKTN
jgi:hypothetical protein